MRELITAAGAALALSWATGAAAQAVGPGGAITPLPFGGGNDRGAPTVRYSPNSYITNGSRGPSLPPSAMQRLDENLNGKVTATEMLNYYWVKYRTVQGDITAAHFLWPKEWPAFAARFDGNKDGNVSKAEMKNQLAVELAANDLNKDGVLTWDEQGGPMPMVRAGTDYAPIDGNGDGKVATDEFKAFYWRKAIDCDRDGDGMISKAEWLAGAVHRRADEPAGTSEDVFTLFDAEKSGSLTRAEIEARSVEVMAALDSDHDGTLSRAEQEANKLTRPSLAILYLENPLAVRLAGLR